MCQAKEAELKAMGSVEGLVQGCGIYRASQEALVVKNPPANGGDIIDTRSVPGLGRSLEEGIATHCSILAWRIPWTEEPGGLWSTVSQRVDMTETTQHADTCYI